MTTVNSTEIDLYEVEVTRKVRICARDGCGNKLAMLNKSELCFACQNDDTLGLPKRMGGGGALRTRPSKLRQGVPPPPRKPRNPVASGACPKGCGKERHRGRCARVSPEAAKEIVQVVMPAPIELPAPLVEMKTMERKNGGITLDTLKSKRVSLAEVPEEAAAPTKRGGRLGAIWEELQELPEGEALMVENRSREHATYTLRNVTTRAKKENRVLLSRVAGIVLYLWLKGKGE